MFGFFHAFFGSLWIAGKLINEKVAESNYNVLSERTSRRNEYLDSHSMTYEEFNVIQVKWAESGSARKLLEPYPHLIPVVEEIFHTTIDEVKDITWIVPGIVARSYNDFNSSYYWIARLIMADMGYLPPSFTLTGYECPPGSKMFPYAPKFIKEYEKRLNSKGINVDFVAKNYGEEKVFIMKFTDSQQLFYPEKATKLW